MATFAKRLFDYYPAQDVGDPRVVMAGIIELFEHYPAEIVLKAISPVYGIPGKFKFLPRIAEIKQLLDDLMPKTAVRAYPVFEALPASDRAARPTYDDLKARCAEGGLILGERGRQGATVRETAEFKKTNGISDEQWNAIPNAR